MIKKFNKTNKIYLIILLVLLLIGCRKKYTQEELAYINKIQKIRVEKNYFMKNDPNSPFNYKGKVKFHELIYYDINPDFVFRSKLYEYSSKDTIKIFGTKGEERKTVRFGYLKIKYQNENYKINVYENQSKNGYKYYSIWFTDKTTNKETYGVGRYLDFEKQSDPDYIYTIDFNLAYNPYCAYNSNYSCAIPTKEDFIPIEIKAGEKKFHN